MSALNTRWSVAINPNCIYYKQRRIKLVVFFLSTPTIQVQNPAALGIVLSLHHTTVPMQRFHLGSFHQLCPNLALATSSYLILLYGTS